MSLRDRARSARTLICLLQGIEGHQTTVELRNENSVVGTIQSVDADMCIHMTGAQFKTLDGKVSTFEQFFIHGKNIRFVHIPDEINIMKTIEKQIGNIQKKRTKSKFEKKIKSGMYTKVTDRKVKELKEALVQMESDSGSERDQRKDRRTTEKRPRQRRD